MHAVDSGHSPSDSTDGKEEKKVPNERQWWYLKILKWWLPLTLPCKGAGTVHTRSTCRLCDYRGTYSLSGHWSWALRHTGFIRCAIHGHPFVFWEHDEKWFIWPYHILPLLSGPFFKLPLPLPLSVCACVRYYLTVASLLQKCLKRFRFRHCIPAVIMPYSWHDCFFFFFFSHSVSTHTPL